MLRRHGGFGIKYPTLDLIIQLVYNSTKEVIYGNAWP